MYQRQAETCPRQEAIRHDVEQLMNALRQLFLLVSVRPQPVLALPLIQQTRDYVLS